eukprot:TRINITY_DN16274_c0_g1_i5.p1 TRINITY_DN16274_c0_g1~~TRINITY_DN16274_c0_g1_i5.p1  ORF type:complete len:119 (+),score=10.23 TRINITY_DN16274_c0_g1_i5:630-986(+)
MPLENALPNAAAAIVDIPNIAPRYASIISPLITIKALSTNPKPMKGASVLRKRRRSCSVVASCTAASPGHSIVMSVPHWTNSSAVRTPSLLTSARSNSVFNSPMAQLKPMRLHACNSD